MSEWQRRHRPIFPLGGCHRPSIGKESAVIGSTQFAYQSKRVELVGSQSGAAFCVCARVSDGLRIHSSALLIEFLIAMQASALGRGRGSFR